MLEHIWVIPFITFVSFWLILFFGKHLPFKGSEIGLLAVGAMYVLLVAEFVAVVQVLVYIGAIIVLFLFGVMLTRTQVGRDPDLDNSQRGPAVVVALFLLGVMSFALVDHFEDTELPDLTNDSQQAIEAARGTRAVADSIFSQFLVPFEVVSILLLAALVGAIVLARRD